MAHVLGAGNLLAASGDANRIVSFVNLQLFDVGFFKQFDQFFDFANIHSKSSPVMSGLSVNALQGCLEGKVIPLATQPTDNAIGDIGKIRVMAERFPRMDIGKMHFNEGDARR